MQEGKLKLHGTFIILSHRHHGASCGMGFAYPAEGHPYNRGMFARKLSQLKEIQDPGARCFHFGVTLV